VLVEVGCKRSPAIPVWTQPQLSMRLGGELEGDTSSVLYVESAICDGDMGLVYCGLHHMVVSRSGYSFSW